MVQQISINQNTIIVSQTAIKIKNDKRKIRIKQAEIRQGKPVDAGLFVCKIGSSSDPFPGLVDG
jgi:hypothetical protein